MRSFDLNKLYGMTGKIIIIIIIVIVIVIVIVVIIIIIIIIISVVVSYNRPYPVYQAFVSG